MMRWFGPRLPAPFYTFDIQRVPTPPICCARCREPIAPHDFGIVMDGVEVWDERSTGRIYGYASLAYHDECHVRSLVGCVEHQIKGVTQCRVDGCVCQDDPTLSIREAAKAATNYFRSRQR